MAKKSIFDPKYKTEVLQRLEKLTDSTTPQWGILKVNEMLRHLSETFKVGTGEIKVPERSTFFTRTLVRYFIMNAKVPSVESSRKRPIKTFSEVDVLEQKVPVEDFASEKARLIKELDRIEKVESFIPRSPMIGNMSREDWGRNFYSHIHYHFTQFGV